MQNVHQMSMPTGNEKKTEYTVNLIINRKEKLVKLSLQEVVVWQGSVLTEIANTWQLCVIAW